MRLKAIKSRYRSERTINIQTGRPTGVLGPVVCPDPAALRHRKQHQIRQPSSQHYRIRQKAIFSNAQLTSEFQIESAFFGINDPNLVKNGIFIEKVVGRSQG